MMEQRNQMLRELRLNKKEALGMVSFTQNRTKNVNNPVVNTNHTMSVKSFKLFVTQLTWCLSVAAYTDAKFGGLS